MSKSDDDAFWAVALMGESTATQHNSRDDESDSDENVAFEDAMSQSRIDRYVIPNSNGVTLSVSPLSSNEGIWSPLGADAW